MSGWALVRHLGYLAIVVGLIWYAKRSGDKL